MKHTYSIIYFILFIVLSFFLSSIYRPYIYKNNINDFGIADIGNNIFFIPCAYFLIIISRKKPLLGKYKDLYLHTLTLIFVEILSKYIKGIGTFDVKDILALIFGGFLTFIILKIHEKTTSRHYLIK